MRSRSILAVAALGLATTLSTVATGSSSATPPAPTSTSGSFALSGAEAAAYQLPADVRELHTLRLPGGRSQTRYQQYVDGAAVLGAQVTVIRSAAGTAETVIGAHLPGLRPTNARKIGAEKARSVVRGELGARGRWATSYSLDPRSGRLVYEIDVQRAAQRPVRWVDAATGKVVKSYSALAHGDGTGVKGDTKTFSTTFNAGTGLYELKSADGRQITFDDQNRKATEILMTDADDHWNLLGNASPAQQAGVDAHYYANVVDDFFQSTFGRNSIDGNGMQIKSVVHYGSRYCNAFWNGSYMTYGDGDGRTCYSLAGGLDVDGHELTHGVTDFTSDLIYQDQPGALNEAFSDMMGNTIEFYADANNLDPVATPDWLIGEDVIPATRTDLTPGFRNMGDPAEDGDPDHMVDLYTGTADSGGVHSNSGIPNHVYYLLVTGGQNAGCTAGAYRTGPTHTEDCEVVVPSIGLDNTQHIFYDAFTSLNAWANFCDARNATVAVGNARSAAQGTAVGLAWDAVGVHTGCTGGVQPPPPCVGDDTASIPFESPHPYGNNGDCTWTYDNGTAGFAFHFSLLDTEKDYDYVYVKDGNGNVLATYTGTYRRGATSPCITTSTGSVQLVTDPGVTAQGFTVDAVVPC